jgi:Concanavalin A-like lectin/glucanases superfamily
MKYCLTFVMCVLVLGMACAEDGVLFSSSYKKSLTAEIAKGGGIPRSGRGGIAEGGGLNAAKGFRPYNYPLAKNILSKSGTIEFRYKPMLPDFPASSKGTTFVVMMQAKAGGPRYNGIGIGLNLKPGNKKYVWAIIKSPKKGEKTSQVYREAELKNGQWYKFAVCWDQDKVALFIDGKMLGKIPRPEKIFGGTQLRIGGAHEKDFAHGLIADFKIYDRFVYSTESKKTLAQYAKCLKFEFPGKKGNVGLRLNKRATINSGQFSVIVDSPVPVILKLSSGKFKINPGKMYVLNFSERPPQYVKADDKGTLSIPLLKPTNYSNILITEVDSKNLLVGAKWHGRVSSSTYTALGWGHEGAGIDSALSTTTVKAGTFSRDNGALVLDKKTRDGEVKWFSDAFKVEAGKEYLFYGYYSIDRPYYGGTAMFRAALRGDGKKEKIIRGIFINPLIAPQNGAKERYMQVRIKVPKGYDKCYVILALRGAAQKISWDKMAVRPAPKTLYAESIPLSIEDRKAAYSLGKVREIWGKRRARSIKVKKESGLPILMVDNKPLALLANNHYVVPSSDGESKAMLKNGVNWQFVRMKSYLHEWWQGKNKYDFSGIQDSIETVLRFDSNAVIMLNIKITPWYREWGYEYPDAVWTNHDGKKTAGYKSHIYYPGNKPLGKGRWDKWAAGYSTEGYRKSVSQALRALAKHLKTFTTGKAVAGAVFWSGTDNQWFPHIKYKGFDFSPGAEKDFRQYLKEIYSGDVNKLRKAWGDSNVTFANAKLSPFSERSKDGLYFLNPAKGSEHRIIDSNKYADAGVSKTINYLGNEFKKAMGRNVYTSVYAPDIMQGYSGRSARKILLEGKGLDGVIAVPDYGLWRLPGRTGNYSSAISSLGLHGKIMLSELDYRTHISHLAWDAYPRLTSQMGGVTNAKQFANQARRDLGTLAAQGGGAWLLAMNRHSYNKPQYMKVIKEVAHGMQLAADKPMPQDRGQIGVFADEDTRNVCQFRYGMSINNVGIGMARMPLLRSGASWDAYYLSDIDTPGRHKYKVYLFLSAPTISAKQISWIKKNLQRDGNVLVFVNAVGMTSDAGSFKSISKELTGMNIKYDMSKISVLRVIPAKSSDKMAKDLKDNVLSELKQPLFYVDDKTATTIGTVKGTTKTGWAVKRFKDWTSVYVSLPGALTPQLLRNIVAEAGITPIGPCDDVTTAGNGFITIHALYNGNKTLRWDKKCDLLDLTTGKLAGKGINTISFDMKAGETRWFRKQ